MTDKIHLPTLAILLSGLTFALLSYTIAVTIEQQAHINRINKTLRTLCGPRAPSHHTEACGQLSIPLDRQVSPFNVLRPSPRPSP